jgi:NAD-dependent SIR2 family protein deacetylase
MTRYWDRKWTLEPKAEDPYGICPKCDAEFDRPKNPNPAGYLCPECRRAGYAVVGVIHFRPDVEWYGDFI